MNYIKLIKLFKETLLNLICKKKQYLKIGLEDINYYNYYNKKIRMILNSTFIEINYIILYYIIQSGADSHPGNSRMEKL